VGGGALVGASIHPDGNSDPSATASLSAGSLDLDATLGFTVSPGFTIGAMFYLSALPGPGASIQGAPSVPTGSLTLPGVGPFIDYYFDPTKGIHIQAAVGYTFLLAEQSCTSAGCMSSNNLLEDYSGSAVSVLAGIGYDWWIAPSFSMGLLARVGYTSGSMTDPSNFKLDLQAPALSLLATAARW
jgi:hypothetical protein